MKQKFKNAAAYALIALLPSILCGFKAYGKEIFPAPFAKPIICFYSNLSASGLYESKTAPQSIIEYALGICEYRKINIDKNAVRAAAESIISNKILSGIIKPAEIFFYLNKSNEFVLLLIGEFSVEKLASLIGKDYIRPMQGGFGADFRLPLEPENKAIISVKKDKLLIASSNVFEVASDHIEFNNNLLSKDFDTFKQMVKANSAIALEASLNKEYAQTAFLGYESPLNSVKHLRFLAHNSQIKLQLFVPDVKQKNELTAYLEPFISGLNESLNYLKEFKKSEKGSSIFVSARSDKTFTGSLEARLYSFFIHFFALHAIEG